MRVFIITVFCLVFSSTAFADRISDLERKRDDLDRQSRQIAGEIKSATGRQLEELVSKFYYLQVDWHSYTDELYRLKIKDEKKLEELLDQLSGLRSNLDNLYYSEMERAKKTYPPEVDRLDVYETERSYGYVTYSVKVDLLNPGGGGKVFLKVKGFRFDGHEIESVSLSGDVEENSQATFTTTTMVSERNANNISKWAVADIKHYPQ